MAKNEVEEIARLLMQTQRLLMPRKPPPAPPKSFAGFTMAQARCLFVITHHENCTLSELGERLGVRPSTASELVERLVRAKFVTRVTDPEDRRIIRLALTSKGRELHQKHLEHRHQQVRELLNKLSPTQQKAMKNALETLQEIMQEVDGGQKP